MAQRTGLLSCWGPVQVCECAGLRHWLDPSLCLHALIALLVSALLQALVNALTRARHSLLIACAQPVSHGCHGNTIYRGLDSSMPPASSLGVAWHGVRCSQQGYSTGVALNQLAAQAPSQAPRLLSPAGNQLSPQASPTPSASEQLLLQHSQSCSLGELLQHLHSFEHARNAVSPQQPPGAASNHPKLSQAYWARLTEELMCSLTLVGSG